MPLSIWLGWIAPLAPEDHLCDSLVWFDFWLPVKSCLTSCFPMLYLVYSVFTICTHCSLTKIQKKLLILFGIFLHLLQIFFFFLGPTLLSVPHTNCRSVPDLNRDQTHCGISATLRGMRGETQRKVVLWPNQHKMKGEAFQVCLNLDV